MTNSNNNYNTSKSGDFAERENKKINEIRAVPNELKKIKENFLKLLE